MTDDEDLQRREAAILAIIANARPSVGVALARKYGRPSFQGPQSKPARRSPGPKKERQCDTRWRDALIYRLWRETKPDFSALAFAADFVSENAIYLTSPTGFKSDVQRNEPPKDQVKLVCYLIRSKGLAVPTKALRNILSGLHKDSGAEEVD